MSNRDLVQKEKKAKIISTFKQSEKDTGSAEVQIALLTDRINNLTDHIKKNKFDFSSQRGLLKLVGQRKRLLNYLKSESSARYLDLIKKLDLRK